MNVIQIESESDLKAIFIDIKKILNIIILS